MKFGKDLDEEDQGKQHILIRDLRPPFLDGKVVFTKQLEPINPVRDPTGDLAVYEPRPHISNIFIAYRETGLPWLNLSVKWRNGRNRRESSL